METEFLQDLSSLGGQWVYGAIALAGLALGRLDLFLQLLVALAFCFAILIPARLIYPKPRPVPRTRKGIYGRLDNPSWPSLHAMRSSALGTVLAFAWPASWFTALAIALVIGVCTMRVLFKRHSISDVIAGAVFGAACGLASVRIL